MLIKSFPHVCQTQVAFAETLDAKIVSVHHRNQNSCNPGLCSVLSLWKVYDMKLKLGAGEICGFYFQL